MNPTRPLWAALQAALLCLATAEVIVNAIPGKVTLQLFPDPPMAEWCAKAGRELAGRPHYNPADHPAGAFGGCWINTDLGALRPDEIKFFDGSGSPPRRIEPWFPIAPGGGSFGGGGR